MLSLAVASYSFMAPSVVPQRSLVQTRAVHMSVKSDLNWAFRFADQDGNGYLDEVRNQVLLPASLITC